MTDPGAATKPASPRALPSLEGPIPALFCAAGAALLTIGALPWVAVLAGSAGIGWILRVLAAVAVLAGVFVLLVGIGLLRARSALRGALQDQAAHAALEAALDAELNATLADADADADAEPVAGQACHDHTACASCDSSCALNALRT